MKIRQRTINIVYTALFIALAYALPYITGQIPEIGAMLCPMHFPIILCGFVCGWQWGMVAGFVAPIMRSILTSGYPPMFPTAVAMAFELAAYGALAGLLFKLLPKKKIYIYVSLISSMIIGRIVWGLVTLILITIDGGAFTFSAFMAGSLLNAIPGIVLQIIIIPIAVMIFKKLGIIKQA